jgi:hypothetical protein
MKIEPKVARKVEDPKLPAASGKPPQEIKLGDFLLSQSGGVMPEGLGTKNPVPLVSPDGHKFTKFEVTSLDESGVHNKRTFDIGSDGVVRPNTKGGLGTSSPMKLTLMDADGNKWSAVIDISPSKTGVSHSGYEQMKGIKLTKELPPAPAEVTLGEFLLSQSGGVMPQGLGTKHPIPLVSPDGHKFESLEVMALDESKVHNKRTFEIGDDGVVRPNSKGGLGTSSPFQLTLRDAEGNKWVAVIDISPSKTGVSHSGYEEMKNVKLRRVNDEQLGHDGALQGVAGDFLKSQSAPKQGKSLFDHMLKR